MYRYISTIQQKYQFHIAISGHEGINKDKDEEGSTLILLSLLKDKNKLERLF